MRPSVPPRPIASGRPFRVVLGGVAIALMATVGACATTAPAGSGGGAAGGGSGADAAAGGRVIQVVAAENFWGSIAAQLGGDHVQVSSIISNPDTDPHSYEPTAADARTVTTARFAIVNGVGYDAWADKLLATNPGSGRTELNVGDLVGVRPGGNPHRWYSPDDVHRVIDAITAHYKKLDPADSASFDHLQQTFETQALARYDQLIAQIKATYAGTPIGASESIVTPLAEGLGLKMLTPESFLDAMSEGTDPTAADKALIDQQIKNRQIKVYVYNRQNSTPDVVAQVKLAESEGIPVATVTETLAPAGATFEQWQTIELQGIQQALHQATGK